MAKQLFKLVFTGVTHTVPTATRYFYTQTSDITVNATPFSIKKSLLWNDAGSLVGTSALTLKTASDGYYSLFVGGVLQQSSIYSVSATGIELTATSATAPYTISAQTPFALSVTNFAPTTVVTG